MKLIGLWFALKRAMQKKYSSEASDLLYTHEWVFGQFFQYLRSQA